MHIRVFCLRLYTLTLTASLCRLASLHLARNAVDGTLELLAAMHISIYAMHMYNRRHAAKAYIFLAQKVAVFDSALSVFALLQLVAALAAEFHLSDTCFYST